MQAASLPHRLFLLPLDLVRMLVLALRISFWHLRVILRTALFRNPSVHSFCHPLRREVNGIRVSICPFAQRFANPRLFSLICTHCRLGERDGRELPLCRRRGGGPASSVTLLLFGIVPVLIFLAAFAWFLHPLTDALHQVESWFVVPAASAPAQPAAERNVIPAPLPREPDKPQDVPTLPPLLQPGHSFKTSELPPPPLGFNPIERRGKATAAPDRNQ